MKYLSVCSGIEAASVAWHKLGWEPLAFSEIEPFPRAVLAHHYPDVPLHGDFTVLRDQPWIVDADILVGGTPCQAFSVAGLRKSLDDDRGNLSLEFVRLADAIDTVRSRRGREPGIIVWENVPGVLSVKDNAFGCFLAALAGESTPLVPPRGKWTNAGVVDGPQRRIAWRTLDAQFFGLAQRRRRVFVVASARDGFDPAAVLLEFEGLRRDTPPRREAGQAASGGATGRVGERSHWDGADNPHPTLNQAFNTGGIGQSNQEIFSQRGSGLVEQPYEVGNTLTARMHKGINTTLDEGQTPIIETVEVSPTIRAEDFDAETVGPLMTHHTPNGHGCAGINNQQVAAGHVIPVAIPLLKVGKRTGPASTDDLKAGLGVGEEGDPMFTLQAKAQHGVAVTEAYAFQPRIARNGRGDMGDVVNALQAQSGETGKGDAAPCVAVAFNNTGQGWWNKDDAAATVRAGDDNGGGGARESTVVAAPCVAFSMNLMSPGRQIREDDGVGALTQDGHRPTQGNEAVIIQQHMAVRRLTPRECEALQGFPPDYTLIPWRKKPADQCPDGPRYKALGNSMAVPVMRWIGERIARHLRGEL